MRAAHTTSPVRIARSPRSAAPARPRARTPVAATRQPAIRPASTDDVTAIHRLIDAHVAEGHLLPRRREELAAHASRFVVAVVGRRVVACADLAPLSRHVAEVRSLVVSDGVRCCGVGRRLVDELAARAASAGFETLCAFTHMAGYFVRMGFTIVPHAWLPEKIDADCRSCALFRTCRQYAVMLPLVRACQVCVPLTSLHA
jgi:N-acetylglutamate synthase-like GNAT family acetyltransferase